MDQCLTFERYSMFAPRLCVCVCVWLCWCVVRVPWPLHSNERCEMHSRHNAINTSSIQRMLNVNCSSIRSFSLRSTRYFDSYHFATILFGNTAHWMLAMSFRCRTGHVQWVHFATNPHNDRRRHTNHFSYEKSCHFLFLLTDWRYSTLCTHTHTHSRNGFRLVYFFTQQFRSSIFHSNWKLKF